MDARKRVDRLNFHDHLAFHQKIEPEAFLERHPLIDDPDRRLTIDPNASELQLTDEAMLVHGLEQPGAKRPMNLETCVHDDRGQSLEFSIQPFVDFVPLVSFVFQVSAPDRFSAV
jgi:hypothetical protein